MSSKNSSKDGKGYGTVVGAPRSPFSGNNKAGKPTPEQPTMRSVGIMGMPSSGFGLQRAALGGPPPLGIARPGSVGLKGAQRYTKSGENAVAKEWSGEVEVPIPEEWKVACLQKIPMGFQLERTSKEIHGSDGTEVASRITSALRKLSVEAEFCGESAKAKCRTTDHVSFRIRLYSGGESGQPVVVEMQRRGGSCCSFMKSCRAILSAAEGIPVSMPSEKMVMPPFKTPVSEMKCLKGVANETKESERELDMKSAFNCSLNLLAQNQRESTILALESLGLLTEPLKTFPGTAIQTSICIALGDESYTVREDIAALLKNEVGDLEFEEGLEGHVDQAYHIRHLALSVFSNALSVTSKEGLLKKAVDEQGWFSEFLIPTLLKEIEVAETCPNVACAALCCLKSLVSSSSVARKCVTEMEGEEALRKARSFGTRRHEMLEEEAKKCLTVLENYAY